MGSPEATIAPAEAAGTPEGSFEELTGSLQGWKRKSSGKNKAGTPKKKDVSYLTPEGEEIKNKRQLDKYLKVHSGALTAADFDWGVGGGEVLTPGETRRRSARLNSKGRSSGDGIDVEVEPDQPVVKRSKPRSRENGKNKTEAVAGKGDVMEDTEKPEEGLADEAGIGDDKNGEVEKKEIPTEEPKAMDVDAPAVKPDIEVPAPEETKEVTTEKLTADTDDTKEAVPHGTNAVQPIGETEEPPKAPAVDEKAVDSELVGQPETEESVKQQDSVAMNEGEEEANGLELDTASIKTKEERRGKGTQKLSSLKWGINLNNLQPCSTSSSVWDAIGVDEVSTATKVVSVTDTGLRPQSATARGPVEHGSQILAVKRALHLSAVPSSVVCRELEQDKVVRFCKSCVLEQNPGSMYVCGCPGTGKSLTMEQVKSLSVEWAEEANMPIPEIISLNCTTLTEPRNIYQKVLQLLKPDQIKEATQKTWSVCFKEIKQCVCESRQRPDPNRMLLMIVDEMDYLITRDQSVLYDLFRLPTYANSRCILMGIANAIDLTERFLPKLRSLNCKPDVVTFPAYTKDQILKVLTQRLQVLPFTVFHPPSLELCARKVAAASGDMRKALHICRSALEILEAEVKAEHEKNEHNKPSSNESEQSRSCQRSSSGVQPNLVRIDHMARALARTFRSPVVETIQNLPQHQQMVLCSAVRLFRRARKDATLGELNRAYLDFCKSSGIHALAGSEFSSMCTVLADQGLLKLGKSREERLRRVTLQVDQDDIVFALQGVRFFRNSLS